MFMNTTFTFVRLKMWRLFFFVVLSLLLPRKAFAESNNTAFQLLPDSSNFVTVSLLVTTPTPPSVWNVPSINSIMCLPLRVTPMWEHL